MKRLPDFETDKKIIRARKRIQDIKGFYQHLLAYCLFCPFIIFINYKTYWDYKWFWFSITGWGISVAIHAIVIFVKKGIFGGKWEERKIEELMHKEENNGNYPVNISEDYRAMQFENKEYLKEQAYIRAKKRIKELKGFYWHTFWYIVVNIIIIIMVVVNGGNLMHISIWPTPLFWGIGLGFHGLGVFSKNLFFGKSWQERKIQEFMEKEKREWD